MIFPKIPLDCKERHTLKIYIKNDNFIKFTFQLAL